MDNRLYCLLVTDRKTNEQSLTLCRSEGQIRSYLEILNFTEPEKKKVVYHVFEQPGIFEFVAEDLKAKTMFMRKSNDVIYYTEDKVEIPFQSKLWQNFMLQYFNL